MTEKRRDCATSGGTVWESRDLVKVSRLINPLDSALCREIASLTVEYALLQANINYCNIYSL